MKKVIIFILSISILISLCSCANVQHGNSVESTNQEPSSSISRDSKNLIDTKSDIKSDALNRMLIAIKYNDLETFKQLVLPEGIFVVRTFISGNGARGKDIIMNVEPNKIGEDITYDVKDEIPIEMVFLFKQSCETDIKNIAEEELTDANIDLNRVSSTTDIWDFCGNAVSKLNNKEWNPHLININENKFILYEGGDVDCTGIGGWAIFERKNDKFYLTGVFDLR